MSNRKFGVIGVGAVGTAIIHSVSKYYDYEMYDILESYPLEPVLSCDAIFICVPTPQGPDGHLDCGIVSDVISELDGHGYGGVIVIKSTVRIGFTQSERDIHPDLRLVYMPEFLRENNSFSWSVNPDRLVVAGDDDDVDEAMGFFDWIEAVPVLRMSYLEAEVGKIAHNAFIAAKVSFTNMVEMLCKLMDADPVNAMSVIWNDRRVNGSSHLRPGIGGYSGKCIPKDTTEMEATLRDRGVDTSLIEGVQRINGQVPPSVMGIHVPVYAIIPTRLDDGLWSRALDSVAGQTVPPEGVVIVHDGGADTAPVIERLESTGLRYRLLLNEGAGLSGALNTAFRALTRDVEGDPFVALLDDDDYWDRRYLQTCASFAADYGCGWVVPGIIREESEGRAERQTVSWTRWAASARTSSARPTGTCASGFLKAVRHPRPFMCTWSITTAILARRGSPHPGPSAR